jgi:hypothetical protein
MMQAIVVTSTAAPTPVSRLGNFPAIRGLKGIQMQASAGGVFYGGNNNQPMAVPDAAPSDVLPVVHLGDLWLKGAGTVTIVCFL